MKKTVLLLICASVISLLMFCGVFALTKDYFWLILSACVIIIVIIVSFLLFVGRNNSRTEKSVLQPAKTSHDDGRQSAVVPVKQENNTVKETKNDINETLATGLVASPFPRFKSEFQDGKGLKQCLDEVKEWCLSTSESQLNPNDKKSVILLFEQLKDCVDCQIGLDKVKTDYMFPFINELKSTETMENAIVLVKLVQLAMLMIDLSQMAHSYGNYETSKEDRLWFNVLKGELSMDEAMKKARKVDDNPSVTPAQYRNLKAFLRDHVGIVEEGFQIYNGYIL